MFVYYTKPLGNTVFEAFACGVPVVVPRTQGFCDTVTDGHNGYLFEPKNIADCKKYIQLFNNDSDLKATMGSAALATVAIVITTVLPAS